MLAHTPNLILIYGFLGCLILGNLAALFAGIGAFVAQRRSLWLLTIAWVAVAFGASATGMYLDSGGGWHWMLALSVIPVIVGVVSLIRSRTIRT